MFPNKLHFEIKTNNHKLDFQHVFPWDYRSNEKATLSNLSASFIHFFVWIGWAWDLKVASDELIRMRVRRTGEAKRKEDILIPKTKK